MTLTLGSTGFATAYASLPIGTFEQEAKRIRHKVRLWQKSHPNDPISEPDIVYLLGQADLAAQIRVGDFRKVFDIRYPTGECNATTVNWVFSVGLHLPQLDLKTSRDVEFQYLLHLRYRRSIFAYENAEEECVRRIIELARENELISGVQVAMGWSDLIVEGSFSNATQKKLTRFIIGVHGIHMIIGGKKTPLFDRMLTIIGYPADDPPPDYDHGHMMFVRALPGKYDQIAAFLKPFGVLHILDGKADFIEDTLRTKPNFLKEQRRLTGKEGRGVFQKIDTHLMYDLGADFERVEKESALCAGIENQRLHRRCLCDKKARVKYRELRHLLFALRRTVLPQEHFHSIENMLFLLGGALKDRSGCCDVRDAVLACYDALETILWSLLEKSQEPLPVVNVEQATRKRQMDIAVSYRRIDEWHRFAEVLLRHKGLKISG